MDKVEKFLAAYETARNTPTEENLLKLIESLLPFSPPGIEWGIEISSVAGVTYMLEGGRVIAVKVSRDEFGPFMQTSIAPVDLSSIPAVALKNIRDVQSFITKTAVHLGQWASKMPPSNAQKSLVEKLLHALETGGRI
ncbi:MAG: hypothetical protein RMI49_01630 [Candidatus Caldarchaeum sp.]|nr:hypothetical protein [Candidatus Caldarchaeum sp.]